MLGRFCDDLPDHVANELRLITWIESPRYPEQDVASGILTRETDTLTDSSSQLLEHLRTRRGEDEPGRSGVDLNA